MGTRSIIVVVGALRHSEETHVARLYKHWDGYPTGNLPIIHAALKVCLEQIAADAATFKDKSPKPVLTSHAIGKLIGEATDVYGQGANLDTWENDSADYENVSGLMSEHLGNQCDLEWIYVIDLKNKHLGIYSGDQKNVGKQFKNPCVYASQLKAEYQEKEITETKELVSQIEALGFSVNKTLDKVTCPKKPKVTKSQTTIRPDMVLVRNK